MQSLTRRKFLAIAGAGVTGSVTAPVAPASTAARIHRYVRLGRTQLHVSDISFGGSRLTDFALVRRAFERGVTYFDTAESYRQGRSEEAMGRALSKVRNRVVIASKSKAGAKDDRKQMMRALEGSLRRLRTDYVDIYYNHAVNDVERMGNPEWHEFTQSALQQGKIRYRGMSGHGSQLAQCLRHALDHKLVDVVLVAHNFAQDPDFYDTLRHVFHFVALQPELPPLLERARDEGVGVIAMKALMGARLNDMRPYEDQGATFAQAALRWILASRKADVALISMTSMHEIDEYLAASGGDVVAAADWRLLTRYLAKQGALYCQHGCSRCEGVCPSQVPIAEVLRTRMYEVDYNDRVLALSDYGALATNASACLSCATSPCLQACPNGVPIATFTRDAARRFS